MTNLSSASEGPKAIIPSGFGLGPRELDTVFPFHFVIDSDTRVIRAGPAIHRLLPDLAGGEKFDSSFKIRHPANLVGYKEICEHSDQLFLLEARSLDKLLLKGQMLYLPHALAIVFIGAPWLTDSSDIAALGLSLNDFAIHDSVPDYLLILRTLKTSLGDAQALAEQLNVMNRQLEKRIEERTQEVVSANATLMETNHRLLQEIAERERFEAELRVAATAFDSQEGMAVTDANRVILRVNHAFTRVTGYSSEEAVGKNPRLLSSGRHDASFYAAMWQSINGTGGWSGEIWNRRKNGEIYPEFLSITAVKNPNGMVSNYVATFNDITMSKAAADEIQHLAFYDPLTRLPNRRLLLNRLQQALASSARNGRKGALLFIDLDHFKNLNDTLGHDIGDLLLQQVAQRLESCVREGDTVARLGGDEFVVMLEDMSEQVLEAAAHAESVGAKILTTLNQPYQLAAQEHHSTPSIGATLFGNHVRGIEELMKQADIAMYQAKKAGRNTLRFFDPQMQDAINIRAVLESELCKALESRQFQLYYQIQVDRSHRPLGAEALIRWNHPERGLVSPAQFIPVAEEIKLILPIGQWVLETACAQIKAWQTDALTRDLVLAVNVSAQQFLQADFVAQVHAAVQHHAINPGLLKLELTESLLLENIEDTIATMNVLNEIGVLLALDDFGTGYSSLQYLKRLPLDQLKIDQSFVRDIATDSNDKAIVRTIIVMAQSLNVEVIAEGVETEEQRQFLQKAGCSQYQGYLFGKPVPIEQFEALLKKG